MMLQPNVNIWLNREPTDMRKSINGLSAIVVDNFNKALQTGDVFIFYNKNRDRIKILYWHYNGFCLLQKRLEQGIFQIPRIMTGNISLNSNQLHRLLEGLYFINKPEKIHDIFY